MLCLTSDTPRADVWSGPLDRPVAHVERLQAVLSPDELKRAHRFRVEHARASFILNRAYLRGILASYLHIPPAEIPITTGPFGKPVVPGSQLRFNVSHSSGLFVCIVAVGKEVGIDIERVRKMPDMEQIARRFFAPLELESWNQMPEKERTVAFFRCWTRKEAFLKATGEGLSRSLETFAVSLGNGRGNCLIAPAGDASRWHVQPFIPGAPEARPADGFVGAIGSRGGRLSIRRRKEDPQTMLALDRDRTKEA